MIPIQPGHDHSPGAAGITWSQRELPAPPVPLPEHYQGSLDAGAALCPPGACGLCSFTPQHSKVPCPAHEHVQRTETRPRHFQQQKSCKSSFSMHCIFSNAQNNMLDVVRTGKSPTGLCFKSHLESKEHLLEGDCWKVFFLRVSKPTFLFILFLGKSKSVCLNSFLTKSVWTGTCCERLHPKCLNVAESQGVCNEMCLGLSDSSSPAWGRDEQWMDIERNKIKDWFYQ